MAIFSKIFDSLMLFRLLKWDEVYVTPVVVTPWSNIVSKVFLGKAFTVTALIGVLSLVKKVKIDVEQ